jgi:hypothetical protein
MSTEGGREARDDAIDRVEKNNELAAEALLAVAADVARERAYFTSDDVWAAADISAREPRVMGAVMRRVLRDGLAEPLQETRQGHRGINHARPQRLWRSLVHRPEAQLSLMDDDGPRGYEWQPA